MRTRWETATVRAAGVAVLPIVALVTIASISASRVYFGYGTETDALGGFIPEAQRFLDGAPLALPYHPPLYSVVLGLVQAAVGDWLRSGLWISGAAAIAVVTVQYELWRSIAGHRIAIAAGTAILCSPVLLTYSALATSDLFFLGFYSLALLVAVRAIEQPSVRLWLGAGMIVGLVLLIRSNGIVLLMLLAAPVLTTVSWRQAWRDGATFVAGVAIPLAAWCVFALLTGAKLAPEGTYRNLAMTYYGEGDRVSAESMRSITGEFDGLIDVLMYDPAHLIRRYLADLIDLATHEVYDIVAFPLSALALGGMLFLAARWVRQPAALAVLAVSLAHVLLLNFKTFEARFYLFLVPVIGAGIGVLAGAMAGMLDGQRHRLVWVLLMLTFAVPGYFLAVSRAAEQVTANDAELAGAIPAVRRNLRDGDVLLARKPHLGFYSDARVAWLPEAADLSVLRKSLCSDFAGRTTYLFFGVIEQRLRPGLRTALADPRNRPDWLTEVDRGGPEGLWVLYRNEPCGPVREG